MTIKERLFILIIFWFLQLPAQTTNDSILYKKPPFWSVKLGFDFLGYQGVDAQLTYFIKDKYSISAGAWKVFRNSDNTPADYRSQLLNSSSYNVGEELLSYGLSGGYLIQIPDTRGRIHLQVGLYYNTLEYPDDFIKKQQGGIIFSSNYTYSMFKKSYFSLVISPALEFPMWNHFGLSFQPKVLLSQEEIYMMINLSINIGNATSKLKRKKKRK